MKATIVTSLFFFHKTNVVQDAWLVHSLGVFYVFHGLPVTGGGFPRRKC